MDPYSFDLTWTPPSGITPPPTSTWELDPGSAVLIAGGGNIGVLYAATGPRPFDDPTFLGQAHAAAAQGYWTDLNVANIWVEYDGTGGHFDYTYANSYGYTNGEWGNVGGGVGIGDGYSLFGPFNNNGVQARRDVVGVGVARPQVDLAGWGAPQGHTEARVRHDFNIPEGLPITFDVNANGRIAEITRCVFTLSAAPYEATAQGPVVAGGTVVARAMPSYPTLRPSGQMQGAPNDDLAWPMITSFASGGTNSVDVTSTANNLMQAINGDLGKVIFAVDIAESFNGSFPPTAGLDPNTTTISYSYRGCVLSVAQIQVTLQTTPWAPPIIDWNIDGELTDGRVRFW